ncbi:MAG: hypothetical protein NXI04_22155 [Planctomycetaceae bacterium]|nr:hypothetical protein [Planctomycetaceae bacterium]
MIMKHLLPLLVLASSIPSMAADTRRIEMTFEGQLDSAVGELKEKIKDDPDLNGRVLRLGKFSGPNLPDSTFDAAFEEKLRELMGSTLGEQSEFVVSGVYDQIEGTLAENDGLDVIQFTIEIRHKRRKLLSVTREINNSADIARINGGTVALPEKRPGEKTDEHLQRRNKAATATASVDGSTGQDFDIKDGTRVTAKGAPDYAVEILTVKNGGTPKPVTPRAVNGRAFVDIAVGEKIIVKAYNYDSKFAAIAKIAIDGLDVVNTFSEDSQKYGGYVVPKGTSSGPGVHAVPGWLITTRRSTDNVYEFVVNKLGEGAATEMKSRHRLGVMHVEFYVAVPENGSLPRGHGEIGRGKTMDVGYEVKPLKFRDSPVANISIRYSNR